MRCCKVIPVYFGERRAHELGGEVKFTGIFEKLNMRIENVREFNPYPINWQDIQYYRANLHKQRHLVNGRHIFSIGLNK